MPKPKTANMQRLSQMCDPVGLCDYIGEMTDFSPERCDHTFTHARAFFAEYSPDVDVEQAIELLQEMGAHCDCEIGLNVCPQLF